MRRHLRYISTILVLLALVTSGLMIPVSFQSASAQRGGSIQQPPIQQPGAPVALSAAAQAQITELIREKQNRTSEQKKIHSGLLYAMKMRQGLAMTSRGEVRTLRSAAAAAKLDDRGMTSVEIKGEIDKALFSKIRKLNGEIEYVSPEGGILRARIAPEHLESVAAEPNVKFIRPAMQARTHRQLDAARGTGISSISPSFKTGKAIPSLGSGSRPNFDQRAMNVRTQLTAALTKAGARRAQDIPLANTGRVTSQGDTAHGALAGRNFFGVNGAGVKIGVLSDSVDFLAQSVASGDLPANVTVLPGQSGVPGSGEGTAMLEIIYDLAPGAQLFFATAFTGINSFADNIRALRAAGCHIIVDDVIYANESPFHDDIVSTAVEEVVADGALYFSSAGNQGNFNDGTSSAWEGDFRDSRTTLPSLPGGTLHDFGNGVIANRAESTSAFILGLWWSDPLGASGNDYDFFIMDNTLTTVLDASTNLQDGDDDPFEFTLPGAFGGERILIFKAAGAERRALHLNNFGGQLGIATPGSTHGHNSVAGAFGVAAIDVALAGTGTFAGGPTNPVELFSSDGFRRVFYKSDGTAFTPGSILFSNNGGQLRRKPDLTAADGVATSVPTFPFFFGTSAAAPHAAAIAALLKSAKPRATPNRIRQALQQSAIDIEAIGRDRDSGFGIVDAFGALLNIGAAPSPFLQAGTIATTDAGGDGDGIVEPGEGGSISATLTNIGGATALGVSATLSTMTPGVTIVTATSNYPNIGSNGQSATNNVPFTFNLDNTAACGQVIDFALTINYANSPFGPEVFNFSVQTGQPGPDAVISYTGAPVPIPDANIAGVNIPITVSGLTGPINGLKFSFDGSSCSNAIGATTVGLDHTWVGDLVVTLTSPSGTTVTLMNRPGGIFNDGNNFCNTVLDDSAAALIQNISFINAPFSGMFAPANPLAAFNGQDGNGVWTLNVSDPAALDTGNVRAFSLSFRTFVCTGP
jgi:subtilisin-like proprotein convertase family protein